MNATRRRCGVSCDSGAGYKCHDLLTYLKQCTTSIKRTAQSCINIDHTVFYYYILLTTIWRKFGDENTFETNGNNIVMYVT